MKECKYCYNMIEEEYEHCLACDAQLKKNQVLRCFKCGKRFPTNKFCECCKPVKTK